jgi:membrane-bound lytic murein transglycosylase F
MLTSCSQQPDLLEQVQVVGELRIVTTNSATTYYFGPDGQAGLEYELVRKFADAIGVSLRVVIPPTTSGLIEMVKTGKAHVAAAGLSVTSERSDTLRFGTSYHITTQQVVYRRGSRRPRNVDDLANGQLEVVKGTSYAERLRELKGEHPDLQWVERDDIGVEQLVEAVWKQTLDYTVIDSHMLASLRGLYPEVKIAFQLSGPQALAWAFSKSDDQSLVKAANEFFAELQASGELPRLLEKHFGATTSFDYVDARTFLRHSGDRLPPFRPYFEQAAQDENFDWRLLAALSYQESHWDPLARSPTGVRGLMMLTRATAEQVGVDNRLDPQASIFGGARYLRLIETRIPERIPAPDRIWLALAAYNVGFGHLEDARILTQTQGGDPDNWIEVRERLPLLAREEWYRQTRFGYARGGEPVRFVQNIRRYYDVLQWLTHEAPAHQEEILQALKLDTPVL